MHLIRTIVLAVVATCLAAFPLGMSTPSAMAKGEVRSTATAHHHDHGHVDGDGRGTDVASADGHAHRHAAEAGATQAEADAATRDCADGPGHGRDCCGYACHALAPAAGYFLSVPGHRPAAVHHRQDEQVGDARPSSPERPPRLG